MVKPTLDSVGWTYIGVAIGWSVVLAGGIIYLHINRHLPCLQIRNLPLVFIAVFFLHAYNTACLLGYVIGPLVPCAAEYWVMSIYLPFGVAMFQAANTQFLHVASRQKAFLHMDTLRNGSYLDDQKRGHHGLGRWKRIVGWLNRSNKVNRIMLFIGTGLFVQLVLSLFIFFASRKFHPSYGFLTYTVKGTENARVQCSKGWEWWLSIIWQFFWAWIYAPYTLWKSRGIRDVHGWRTQTIYCCIAGLPATPLWLTGLYVPQMAPVNRYFIPPVWFSASILFIEIFTIGIPIIQVRRTHTLQQKALDAIVTWEKHQTTNSNETCVTQISSDGKDYSVTNVSLEADGRRKPSLDSLKSPMFTMAALEMALTTNVEPLLRFSALKDFSGENISFLMHIAEWKRAWRASGPPTPHQCHSQFIHAVRIYGSCISLDYSEFPINVCAKHKLYLDQIFERDAVQLFGSKPTFAFDSITPFDTATSDASSTVDLRTGLNLEMLGRSHLKTVVEMMDMESNGALNEIVIPDGFGSNVFDDVESEIKYLVLTNTWPRFVHAELAQADLQERNG